jgi:TonB family protein
VVETSPNAEVYLDDQYTGRASPEGRLLIGNPKPGEHNLRVSFAGKKDFQRKVTVVAGQVNKITVVLADLAGTVVVQTSPGAAVFLDDSSRGTADARGQLAVPDVVAGSHELRIAAPGKRDFRQNISVPAGQATRIAAELVDLPVVTTNPPTGGKGELVPAIARTHDELVALAHRADRDYFEFNLSHRKAQQKVGTVTIELDKTDTERKVFTVNLVFDDKPHVYRDKAMNEPVYFYVQGASIAEELVVYELGKDSIAGYISAPKGFFSSTPNVPPIRPGQGEGGGTGGGIFSVGGGVSAPIPIYKPEPAYSEEARKAKYEGTVVLRIVVDAQGNVNRDVRVVKPLGLGLDEKAVQAVQTWKFKPAIRNGVPVPVRVVVEVTFRLKVLLPGAVRENPKDGLNYVWIPPGSFQMGCSPRDNECDNDEKPSHQVTISRGFWIGQTEVTVGAYKRFAAATGRQMPDAPSLNNGWANDNMPIVGGGDIAFYVGDR